MAMATDSATLDRRASTPRRAADAAADIRSPAAPIAPGLRQPPPFFDDK
jgi:hypothetical protein